MTPLPSKLTASLRSRLAKLNMHDPQMMALGKRMKLGPPRPDSMWAKQGLLTQNGLYRNVYKPLPYASA